MAPLHCNYVRQQLDLIDNVCLVHMNRLLISKYATSRNYFDLLINEHGYTLYVCMRIIVRITHLSIFKTTNLQTP